MLKYSVSFRGITIAAFTHVVYTWTLQEHFLYVWMRTGIFRDICKANFPPQHPVTFQGKCPYGCAGIKAVTLQGQACLMKGGFTCCNWTNHKTPLAKRATVTCLRWADHKQRSSSSSVVFLKMEMSPAMWTSMALAHLLHLWSFMAIGIHECCITGICWTVACLIYSGITVACVQRCKGSWMKLHVWIVKMLERLSSNLPGSL